MSIRARVGARLVGAAAIVALGAAPAVAQITVFTAALNGASERPVPNSSTATGFATVTLDQVLNTLLVTESFSGLMGVATGAHIHCCAPATGTAGVAVDFGGVNGFPLGVTSGFYSHLFDLLNPLSYGAGFLSAQGSVLNARNTFVAGMLAGNTYANIHDAQFPAGEIRGQLVATPEPATMGLLALGLLGIAGMRTRRSRV